MEKGSRRPFLAAAQSAAQELRRLGLNQNRPIDPFLAVERLGLVLQFQDLDRLLGAIVPGTPPGVLINAARPVTLQRFTAAHEIGHWVMDRETVALDGQTEVDGHQHLSTREQRAQVFAAHFLMPLPLLTAVANKHGVRRAEPVTPLQAYAMARDMRVSYAAVVNHLQNLHYLTTTSASRLRRVSPVAIKQELAATDRLDDRRADVWTPELDDVEEHLHVAVGDQIVVHLTENPSTGYRWMLRCLPDAQRPALAARHPDTPRSRIATASIESTALQRLSVDQRTHRSTSGDRIGGPVTRTVSMKALSLGEWDLEFAYARPFDMDTPRQRLHLRGTVEDSPAAQSRRRWLEQFQLESATADEGDRGR